MAEEPVDFQRSRVYLWEDSLPLPKSVRNRPLSLDTCQEIADEACELYGVKRVVIRGPRSVKQTVAYYRPTDHTISLPDWARNKHIVLHEVAHAIVEMRFGVRDAGHGERFVGVLMYLFEHFDIVESKIARTYANQQDVYFRKVAPPSERSIKRTLSCEQDIESQIAFFQAELKRLRGEKRRNRLEAGIALRG